MSDVVHQRINELDMRWRHVANIIEESIIPAWLKETPHPADVLSLHQHAVSLGLLNERAVEIAAPDIRNMYFTLLTTNALD